MRTKIAVAQSRLAKRWRNEDMEWADFVARCKATVRTNETVKEYAVMSRDEQSNIKDVGGFVGGYLADGVRKTPNVRFRSMLTLDIDNGDKDVWDDFTMNFGCAAVLYSTHKHTPEKPRYRLCIPVSRELMPNEYEAVARRVAKDIGMERFDQSTYQLARLFYWPSTSKDGEFVFKEQKGNALNADKILSAYHDFRDSSEWPVADGEQVQRVHEMKKAGDPREKSGAIGAFCRAYTIEEAIEQFLQDEYEPTKAKGRYTYKLGSVAGGLVCYDHIFAYANNDTDPASRKLCNAFDLVRIHKFGNLDDGSRAETPTGLPSHKAMISLAVKDKRVAKEVASVRLQSAADDFDGMEPEDDSWKSQLDVTKTGNLSNTPKNFALIVGNDDGLKGRIWRNTLAARTYTNGGLPWDKQEAARQWTDTDHAQLRLYVSRAYGIEGKEKLFDAVDIVASDNARHPVREYLKALVWDGTPRLDTLLVGYLHAEDTELNRAMTRKAFTACVARAFEPGCKFDNMLILQGPQGVGKSVLLRTMGGGWFSDSVSKLDNSKEAMESITGAWIVEIGELVGLKTAELENAKTFLSKNADEYRKAYGRESTRIPRQCVFFGTTNEEAFCKGDTGNRRYWIVPITRTDCMDFKKLEAERDQVWAEAVVRYKAHEPLYLPAELEKASRERQDEFNINQSNPLEGSLLGYLGKPVPADWDNWSLVKRQQYYSDPGEAKDAFTSMLVERRIMTKVGFICECLNMRMTDKSYLSTAHKVGKIMRRLDDWKPSSVKRDPLYGMQQTFVKTTPPASVINDTIFEDDEDL